MRFSVLFLILTCCAFSQKSNRIETGTVDAHAATWIPPTTTFASPPTSPPTGAVYIFTDASALGTCSGSGTARATCRWNGSAWEATGGGGGGGGMVYPGAGVANSTGSAWGTSYNASTTINGQTCSLGSTCTISTGASSLDILRFSICITAGCGSETTLNYIATMGAGSFTECAFNLATAATGSSVIVDVQDGSGTSIFGGTKLVVTVANGTAVEYQSTFASSPQNYARGNKYKAVVTQNDSGGTAQGGTVQCR